MGKDPQVEIERIDIFRDTPVRYLGYANEIGEAFRAQIGKHYVRGSYAVAILYVLADTTDKSFITYRAHKDVSLESTDRTKKIVISAIDTLSWQMLASVAIPGFTINRICASLGYILKKTPMSSVSRKWTVTCAGLAAIPFIIKPIDRFVDRLMDESFRKWFV